MRHRVVITGMGMVSPLGLSLEESWKRLLAGESAVRLIDEFATDGFPARIAATITGFDPANYMDARDARRSSRFTQLAVAAVSHALADAGLDPRGEDATRVGIQMGSAVGGLHVIEEQAYTLRDLGARRINPTLVPSVIVSAAACQIAVQWGIKGPTGAPAAACATGITAIGEAARWLQQGFVDVVVAGGAESTITPLALASFGRLGALSSRNDDPARACRPFDATRDGTVVGEGAAALVMETEEHARRRGARILAEVVGYGFTEDAFHMTAPDPSGEGAARAMAAAMAEGGLRPEDVDHIVAHGTGTPLNDVAETRAIHTVLGERAMAITVNSNKAGIGHTLGAAGAISTVVAVKTILEGVLPPTANLETPDPECDLDYVPQRPRLARVDTVLVNAFGFGGQNGCLALCRWCER